jgi:hypothetical protein
LGAILEFAGRQRKIETILTQRLLWTLKQEEGEEEVKDEEEEVGGEGRKQFTYSEGSQTVPTIPSS